MTWILIALAIAPGIAIALFIYFKDEHEREPRGLLLKTFLSGMLVTILAGVLELGCVLVFGASHSLWYIFAETFLIIALIEEGCKYYLLTVDIYKNDEFNEPFDGITYSVMISMGFATFENIFYVLEGGMEVALLRMLTAVPAHAAFGIMMGFFVGLAKFDEHTILLRRLGLWTAVLFHGLYDFFLLQKSFPALEYGAFVVLAVALVISTVCIKILNQLSPFRPQPIHINAAGQPSAVAKAPPFGDPTAR